MEGAGTPDDADVDAVMGLLEDWWTTGLDGEASLRSLSCTLATLVRITAQKIKPTPAAAIRELSVGTVGTSGTALVSPQAAIVLSLRTPVASRRTRGRMYLPGIPTTVMQNNGVMQTASAQAFADSADGMRRDAEGLFLGDGSLVVYSRTADTWETVTAIRVGNSIDTQRRRQVKPETYVVGT
jgi:hypothetical protein